MKKLMIMTGIALSALSVSALGSSGPVRAAGYHTADVTASHLPMGEDGDDGDDEGAMRSSGSGGGSGAGSGSGSLAATGSDATSIALIGALALAAGGATYRLSLRRQQQR